MNAIALEILHRAQAAGVELIPNGDRLKIRAPQRPPDDLLEALRLHKAELLAMLDVPPRRYTYRFRLRGVEGGGVVVTDEPDLAKARDSLLRRYGARLAAVMSA